MPHMGRSVYENRGGAPKCSEHAQLRRGEPLLWLPVVNRLTASLHQKIPAKSRVKTRARGRTLVRQKRLRYHRMASQWYLRRWGDDTANRGATYISLDRDTALLFCTHVMSYWVKTKTSKATDRSENDRAYSYLWLFAPVRGLGVENGKVSKPREWCWYSVVRHCL